jgi:hypothetical protein
MVGRRRAGVKNFLPFGVENRQIVQDRPAECCREAKEDLAVGRTFHRERGGIDLNGIRRLKEHGDP